MSTSASSMHKRKRTEEETMIRMHETELAVEEKDYYIPHAKHGFHQSIQDLESAMVKNGKSILLLRYEYRTVPGTKLDTRMNLDLYWSDPPDKDGVLMTRLCNMSVEVRQEDKEAVEAFITKYTFKCKPFPDNN
jgi:hypothetical protein